MFGAVRSALPERATPRYWERAGKESNVGEFVSIGAPLSQHDTATRSGDCLRVWRLDGVAFESAEFNLVKDRHDAWCNVLRNLPAGRTAIYHHRIHRRIHDRLTDATEPEFSAAFSKAYQDRISVAPMMSNELYITLLYRPFPSELAKRSVRASRTKESLTDYQNQTLATMEQQGALIERSLREFGPTARLLRTGREPVLGVGRAVLFPHQRCVAQGALSHRPRVPGPARRAPDLRRRHA